MSRWKESGDEAREIRRRAPPDRARKGDVSDRRLDESDQDDADDGAHPEERAGQKICKIMEHERHCIP